MYNQLEPTAIYQGYDQIIQHDKFQADLDPNSNKLEDSKNNATITDMEIGENHTIYSSIVRFLMYAMMGIRLDIAYAVSILRQFSANPKRYHQNAEKQIL